MSNNIKKDIKFIDWYKFNYVDNTLMIAADKIYVEIFKMRNITLNNRVICAYMNPYEASVLFGHLSLIMIRTHTENNVTALSVVLYVDTTKQVAEPKSEPELEAVSESNPLDKAKVFSGVKKYELVTDETITVGDHILYRIRALRDMPECKVKAGDFGGYIEKEDNLSHTDDAWVSGNAKVYGNAWVFDNAKVYGNARVSGNAWVSSDAKVSCHTILTKGNITE